MAKTDETAGTESDGGEKSDYWTRDGVHPSLWQAHAGSPLTTEYKPTDRVWDVLVVGGGITGLSTALRLQEAGKRCIIAEAHQIGFGTTGGTTAHINTMLDTPYPVIESDFGLEGAKLVARATQAARDLIARNVSAYQIACDFEYKDGILFSQTEQEEAALKEIYDASQRAGVDVQTTDIIPVPLDFRSAIKFPMQAQFHPLNYLHALAREFISLGGTIWEGTRVLSSKWQNDTHRAETDNNGVLHARAMIYATHIPPGVNVLHFRCAPYRSYVVAAQLADDRYPDALAYDMHDPYHYFRTHQLAGKRYLIVGGADHKTGHGDPNAAVQELNAYVHRHFEVASVDYTWSAQYFEPADGMPYIGKLPGGDDHTYVATGFSGNGILFGSFSALLLSDLILEKENEHEELFSPLRIKAVAGFNNFVKENADVVCRFVADRLRVETLETRVELPPNSGAVVRIDNKKIALYKSTAGVLHALSPVCTHAGCIVAWNDVEKSWDCPCHGGRYDVEGKVLTGPPRKDLEVIPLD